LALAETGHDLILNYAANHAAAAQTAADCRQRAEKAGRSIRVETVQADISKAADRDRLAEAARSLFGKLHLLVNNAGAAPRRRADMLESEEEEFDRAIGINLRGPYFLTRQIARWMIEQTEAEAPRPEPRRIVNISSISAYTASVARAEYCLSKAALSMMTRLFAVRLAEHGIRVYEVRPGIIATDMTAPVKEKYDRLIQEGLTPIRRWGTPEDVAKAVAAIARGTLDFSTGETINVDGGFHLRSL